MNFQREFAAGHRVYLSHLVLLETEWVLRSRYSVPKNLIVDAISGLLDSTDVRLEDESAIEEALFIWKDPTADFADCLMGGIDLFLPLELDTIEWPLPPALEVHMLALSSANSIKATRHTAYTSILNRAQDVNC